MSKPLNVWRSVEGCPRCGRTHRPLLFKPFSQTIGVPEQWTHWAMCSRTRQPILAAIVILKRKTRRTAMVSVPKARSTRKP